MLGIATARPVLTQLGSGPRQGSTKATQALLDAFKDGLKNRTTKVVLPKDPGIDLEKAISSAKKIETFTTKKGPQLEIELKITTERGQKIILKKEIPSFFFKEGILLAPSHNEVTLMHQRMGHHEKSPEEDIISHTQPLRYPDDDNGDANIAFELIVQPAIMKVLLILFLYSLDNSQEARVTTLENAFTLFLMDIFSK